MQTVVKHGLKDKNVKLRDAPEPISLAYNGSP